MERRQFEKLGIESSLLGFGCMRFPLDENGNIEEKGCKRVHKFFFSSRRRHTR